MKTRLGPADTATQDIRNLPIAQMMQVSEDQHFSVFFRQMIPEIVEDTPLEFTFNDRALWVDTVSGNKNLPKTEGGMAGPLPVIGPEDVDGDLGQPCPEGSLTAKARYLIKDFEEGFLSQVVSGGGVPGQPEHQVVEVFLLPFKKIIERVPVAALDALDQDGFLRFSPPEL